jgi:hypothetical protein
MPRWARAYGMNKGMNIGPHLQSDPEFKKVSDAFTASYDDMDTVTHTPAYLQNIADKYHDLRTYIDNHSNDLVDFGTTSNGVKVPKTMKIGDWLNQLPSYQKMEQFVPRSSYQGTTAPPPPQPKKRVKLKPDAKVEPVPEAVIKVNPVAKEEAEKQKKPETAKGEPPTIKDVDPTKENKIPETPKVEKVKKIEETINQAEKKTEMPKWMEKHFQHPSRFAHAAGIGAVLGLAKAVTDDTDDDSFSAAGKAAGGAALGVAASYGGELALGAMGITSKDLVRSQIAKQAKESMSVVDEVHWQNNMKMKLGVVGAIGIAAIGVASLVDVGSKLADDRKASEQRNQQEQELIQRQNREKQKQGKMGYGYVDYGQVVLQQYQKRIGHYAMGNAKFQ